MLIFIITWIYYTLLNEVFLGGGIFKSGCPCVRMSHLCLCLDLGDNNPKLSHKIPVRDDQCTTRSVPNYWLQKVQNFRRWRYGRNIYIYIYIMKIWAHTVTTDLEDPNIFAWHSGSWWCTIISNFIKKCYVIQKISNQSCHLDYAMAILNCAKNRYS